jgi:D-alanyl-D-alanine carboxypeptidase (penicillin-binding protein 5/6)
MKRILVFLLCAALLSAPAAAVETRFDDAIPVPAPSAILVECSTGTVLYEKNADERLPPASVTKVMTMLLVAEAVDAGTISLSDTVTASARAAGMGGSQIWLEEGEQMSVGEMLKCVAVVSANDCCVALAEHLCGSEAAFVANMNARAAALGMEDTHFTSCSGLSESGEHYSTARDIAVMSRELLRHDLIREYTTVWMDTIRDGAFGLTNTNRLVYSYPGATGLKTGFTSRAMFCLAGSAARDGVEYVAVALHAATSAERFESVRALLDHAFANYTLLTPAGMPAIPPVPVSLGAAGSVQPRLASGAGVLTERGAVQHLRYEFRLPETLTAPVEAGQTLGAVEIYTGETLLQTTPLVAADAVPRLTVLQLFGGLLRALVTGHVCARGTGRFRAGFPPQTQIATK